MLITPDQRRTHRRWLHELTQIPTAAGRESRVIAWIERWASERPGLELTRDSAGNLHLAMKGSETVGGGAGSEVGASRGSAGPVYFTAHLDHPAFVVERVIGPGTLQLSFRGGVMDDYFKEARVVVFDGDDEGHPGTLRGEVEGPAGTFKNYLCELDESKKHAGESPAPAERLGVGDVAVWELPGAEEIDGCIHTWACDDLAALAAAVAAYDVLYQGWSDKARLGEGRPSRQDVRLLFTRAEEVGFIGAIAACRHRTMPANARVLALENSRSFADSPIGGGPIVRVGDRLSVFSPGLTAAVAARAEEIAGGPATVTASQKASAGPAWKWQRKLMAGGACEATVFCHAGYEATCLCLPLGNYHNMADLAAVQAGTNTSPPKVGREFVSLSDFDGLVDLLVACGGKLASSPPIGERIEKLWAEKKFVLEG